MVIRQISIYFQRNKSALGPNFFIEVIKNRNAMVLYLIKVRCSEPNQDTQVLETALNN